MLHQPQTTNGAIHHRDRRPHSHPHQVEHRRPTPLKRGCTIPNTRRPPPSGHIQASSTQVTQASSPATNHDVCRHAPDPAHPRPSHLLRDPSCRCERSSSHPHYTKNSQHHLHSYPDAAYRTEAIWTTPPRVEQWSRNVPWLPHTPGCAWLPPRQLPQHLHQGRSQRLQSSPPPQPTRGRADQNTSAKI